MPCSSILYDEPVDDEPVESGIGGARLPGEIARWFEIFPPSDMDRLAARPRRKLYTQAQRWRNIVRREYHCLARRLIVAVIRPDREVCGLTRLGNNARQVAAHIEC
jgi:hypothetical protein